MTYETITLAIENQIATITLNKPERLNACSLDMADEISDALDRLDDARVLVIKGEGGRSARAPIWPRGVIVRSPAGRAATSR